MLSKPLVEDLVFDASAFGAGKRKLVQFICSNNYVVPNSDDFVCVETWVVQTLGTAAKKEKFIFIVGGDAELLDSDKGKDFCWKHHFLCVNDSDFTPQDSNRG